MISTSTTTLNSTLYKTTYLFEPRTVGMVAQGSFGNIQILEDPFPKSDKGCYDLVSDQPKVVVTLTLSYYHFMHDHFGDFLAQYHRTPNALFLVDITKVTGIDNLPSYVKQFFKFMNDKKIDYLPVDLNAKNRFNINNVYVKHAMIESMAINNPAPQIYEWGQQYIKNPEAEATKKVFLSRKNFQDRDLSRIIRGRLPYPNDNRIDDEEKIRDYFKQIGFEVVVPEDFKSFEDQIRFFYEVKTIVSTTSSGLTNLCFMRPGSKVIELVTPLISFDHIGDGVTSKESIGQEELHHFYTVLSNAMDHKYMAISNRDRSAENIINKIESNPDIKAFITY